MCLPAEPGQGHHIGQGACKPQSPHPWKVVIKLPVEPCQVHILGVCVTILLEGVNVAAYRAMPNTPSIIRGLHNNTYSIEGGNVAARGAMSSTPSSRGDIPIKLLCL